MLERGLKFLTRKAGPYIGSCFQNIPGGARIFSEKDAHIFFGYYDVSPFSRDGRRLLACRAAGGVTSPHRSHIALETGYFDLAETGGPFRPIGATQSWNWQQGCRLQWMPCHAKVVYNITTENGYGSVIQNLDEPTDGKLLPWPVYKISPDGKSALSLNFSRLHRLRPGYGYSQYPDETQHEKTPSADGVWIIDIDAGKRTLIFSLDHLAGMAPLPDMENAEHYVNHLDFSPDGSRVCFMHLWITAENKRRNRIIVCDTDGANVIIPTNEGHASHHCWRSEDEILIYSRMKATGERYHLFNLASEAVSVIGDRILREDGHPSFTDFDGLVTDTYPDALRLQHLFRIDCEKSVKTEIARFFMPSAYTKELRCDLHPRLSHDRREVCVDMVQSGRRAMCVLPV